MGISKRTWMLSLVVPAAAFAVSGCDMGDEQAERDTELTYQDQRADERQQDRAGDTDRMQQRDDMQQRDQMTPGTGDRTQPTDRQREDRYDSPGGMEPGPGTDRDTVGEQEDLMGGQETEEETETEVNP
jgi:Ni/Co efflux regulator RcnB